jgi:hypothetical protein
MAGTALRKVSEIGYPAVEFTGFGGLSLGDISAILEERDQIRRRRP